MGTVGRFVPGTVKKLGKRAMRRLGYTIVPVASANTLPDSLDDRFKQIFRDTPGVGGFDLTLHTTYSAVEYLVRTNRSGDLIECGVHRGRQVLMMAETLLSLGVT